MVTEERLNAYFQKCKEADLELQSLKQDLLPQVLALLDWRHEHLGQKIWNHLVRNWIYIERIDSGYLTIREKGSHYYDFQRIPIEYLYSDEWKEKELEVYRVRCEIEKEKAEKKRKKQEEKDHAEYERLKAKFERGE